MSLIKVPVPLAFLLKWFLKSLVPQLSKDVAMSGVFSKEEAIMRAQQLEMIYSQSGFIYKVLPDSPWSILDTTRHKSGPHADDIGGSTQAKPTDLLSNQLHQLSIQKIAANQTSILATPPTQTLDVHSVQSTNPKANQQDKGKKKQRNKGKGDQKPTNNVGGGNTERNKLKYPCKLWAEDHLNHMCPRIVEAQNSLAQ
jgi:hypothetical protein